MLVTNPNNVLHSGVGEPFLHQDVRYHCPVFSVFKFTKPHPVSIKRRMWKYEEGNYVELKHNFNSTDWNALIDIDVDTYTSNITNHVLALAKESIPNKHVVIRQSDPPWMHHQLRKLMRQRKRLYDKQNIPKTYNIGMHIKE